MNKDGKALVVFFSHAGDNYAVGNIEVAHEVRTEKKKVEKWIKSLSEK